MSRTSFAIMMIAIAAVILALMWWAWRARNRRDATLAEAGSNLTGELIAMFPAVSYVSTTPIGSPFERIAIPGLQYKGIAEVEVRRDGVSIAVTGADPVRLGVEKLLGSDTAGGRIGKIVERDGLSLLRWQPEASGVAELESSFRFANGNEQRLFAEAIAEIVGSDPESDTHVTRTTDTTQEDA